MAKLTDARTHGAVLPSVKEPWVVFDLIGVLAEPSWREISSAPDLEKWRTFRVGECSEEAFWSEGCAKAYRALLGFRPDRLAYLQQLKERGFHICLATNFASAWWDTLKQKLPQPLLVDKVLISGQIGVAKPDPRFFDVLGEYVPKGSLLIDDSAHNCVAAEAAGFRTVWTYSGIALEAVLDAILGIPAGSPKRSGSSKNPVSKPLRGESGKPAKQASVPILHEQRGGHR